MTSEQERRWTKSKALDSVKQYFGYEVIWILPMGSKRREKWAKIRANGLFRYMLRNILVSAVLTAVLCPILRAVSFGFEPQKLKRDLIIGGIIGAVSGLGAYLSWEHNEVEYTKRQKVQSSPEGS